MKKRKIIAFTFLALLMGISPVSTVAQDNPTRTFGSHGGKDDKGKDGKDNKGSRDNRNGRNGHDNRDGRDNRGGRGDTPPPPPQMQGDRKSTRLNSSHNA